MDIKTIRIAEWNANGLLHHKLELIQFLQDNKIDVLLVSETHCTIRTVLKIPNYSIYHCNHPMALLTEVQQYSFVQHYNIMKLPLIKQTKYKLLLSKLKHSHGLLT